MDYLITTWTQSQAEWLYIVDMILVVRQAGLNDLALHPESPREQLGV